MSGTLNLYDELLASWEGNGMLFFREQADPFGEVSYIEVKIGYLTGLLHPITLHDIMLNVIKEIKVLMTSYLPTSQIEWYGMNDTDYRQRFNVVSSNDDIELVLRKVLGKSNRAGENGYVRKAIKKACEKSITKGIRMPRVIPKDIIVNCNVVYFENFKNKSNTNQVLCIIMPTEKVEFQYFIKKDNVSKDSDE